MALLGGCLPLLVFSAEDYHDFTDLQNRHLKAAIVTVVGQDVSLKREDGENFKVKISVFSDPDQDYIRQWAFKQAVDLKGKIFALTATQNKSSEVTAQTSDMNEQKWQAGYKVILENQTSMELQKLRIDYQIFKHASVPGSVDPSADPVVRVAGSSTLDLVPPGGSSTIMTVKTPMSAYTLNSGYRWASGANSITGDSLQGIWMRIYTSNGDLIQEWCSAPSIMKKQKWEDASQKKPTAGGGED